MLREHASRPNYDANDYTPSSRNRVSGPHVERAVSASDAWVVIDHDRSSVSCITFDLGEALSECQSLRRTRCSECVNWHKHCGRLKEQTPGRPRGEPR